MRLRVLFTVALLGTHAVIALALLQVTVLLAVGYLVLTSAALTLLLLRTRPAPQRPEGRTCDCCTSTVHDPVEVR